MPYRGFRDQGFGGSGWLSNFGSFFLGSLSIECCIKSRITADDIGALGFKV